MFITPEIYDHAKKQRFPVLYWLHGTGGGERGLPIIVKHFDSTIKKKKIPPIAHRFSQWSREVCGVIGKMEMCQWNR